MQHLLSPQMEKRGGVSGACGGWCGEVPVNDQRLCEGCGKSYYQHEILLGQGLTSAFGSTLRSQMKTQFTKMHDHFNQMDTQFTKMHDHFNQMDDHFNQMDTQFTKVQKSLNHINTKLGDIKEIREDGHCLVVDIRHVR